MNGTRPPNTRYRRSKVSRDVFPQVRDIRPKFPQDYRDPEPDLEFRAFCTRRRLPASSTPQLERAWDAWQAERYQRGEIGQRRPGYTDNPFRPR
jgi:hypothetical protein